MQVYIEYALFENFSMDFALFLCAKWVSHNPTSYFRLFATSVTGACFAVLFPLFGLDGFLSQMVKWLSAIGLCMVAGKYSTCIQFCRFALCFLGLSLLTGGFLYALFLSFTGEYMGANGVLIMHIPVGMPLLAVTGIALLIKYFCQRKRDRGRDVLYCRLIYHGKQVQVKAFFDTGNCVYDGGQPVSVIPQEVAIRLNAKTQRKITIRTVAGESQIPLFTMDKIKIYYADKPHIIRNVQVAVSSTPLTAVVLHPDLGR